MRIALITDTHWGVRGDQEPFLDNNKRFLDKVFLPYLEENGITTIVHLGDMVDRRKYVNYNTANRLRLDFLEPLRKYDCHFIVGNHDCHFRSSNRINSMSELIEGKYDNIKVYADPTEVEFDGIKVLMIPWINNENRKATFDLIGSTKAQIAMGHLELMGFEMYRGSIMAHGDDPKLFSKFDIVLSGHYHHKSDNGRVFYLGSHAEFTWSDFEDDKGFHVFDTDTRELTFIKNPFGMFTKVWYNDADTTLTSIVQGDYSIYLNKIVKVIVTEKTNPHWFDIFTGKIEAAGAIDVNIVDDHLNLNLEDDNDIVNEAESTLDIFKKFISGNDLGVDKAPLEGLINSLYAEAMTIQ